MITPNTKLAELQILKPEETKSIRPVRIAALNLITDYDDVVTYVNAFMPVERPEDNKKNFCSPMPDNLGNESNYFTIQKPILKKFRE